MEKELCDIALGIVQYFLDECVTCIELRGPAISVVDCVQFLRNVKVREFCFVYLLERTDMLYF